MVDVTEQAKAAVEAGDREQALQLLAWIGAVVSELPSGAVTGLLGDALIATAAAKPTTEDADAIAGYRAVQARLDQILRLIADTPLDLSAISAIRGELREQEIGLTTEEERQETDDRVATGRQRRVGRGWLEAKLIRGYGPYWYWRYRDGETQRSKYLGKAPPDGDR
jgi:hypothetical protein